MEDVTARKLVDSELRHERDLNNAMLDVAGALIVVVDADLRIVRLNRLLTGYPTRRKPQSTRAFEKR